MKKILKIFLYLFSFTIFLFLVNIIPNFNNAYAETIELTIAPGATSESVRFEIEQDFTFSGALALNIQRGFNCQYEGEVLVWGQVTTYEINNENGYKEKSYFIWNNPPPDENVSIFVWNGAQLPGNQVNTCLSINTSDILNPSTFDPTPENCLPYDINGNEEIDRHDIFVNTLRGGNQQEASSCYFAQPDLSGLVGTAPPNNPGALPSNCNYSFNPTIGIYGSVVRITITNTTVNHQYRFNIFVTSVDPPQSHYSSSIQAASIDNDTLHWNVTLEPSDFPWNEYSIVATDTTEETDGAINPSCSPTTGTTFTIPEGNPQGDPPVNIEPFPLPQGPADLSTKGFTEENLIGKLVSVFLPIILGIGGFITVIFIIISGIQLMFSSGNPEAAAAARSRLTMALVGFTVILLAIALTQIIDKLFLGTSGVF